jgi:TolA-binding protein
MAQRKKKTAKQEDVLIDIKEVTGQAEDFFERYQKQILIGVTALVVIVGGYLAYSNFYQAPRQKEALEQMAQAEWQFERDSFSLALANPGGGFPGFADIVKNYGGTKAGNAALYYAGICCLNMGQFDAAISYLKDYSAKGEITPAMKLGALGDAWCEKGDLNKGLNFYNKAVKSSNNDITAPYYLKKVAMLQQKQGKNEEAIASWKKIQEEYNDSPEARDAEKYLARLQ